MSSRFILAGMARRLHNWNYNRVTDFLIANGYSFYREVGGSHEAWIKRGKDGELDTVVGIHFTHKSYHINAMKRMIKESGLAQEVWIKWGKSESF